jgi:hypothetical protein
MTDLIYGRSGRQWDYLYMNELGIDFIDQNSYTNFFGEEEPINFENRQYLVDELLSYDLENISYNEQTSDQVVTFLKKLDNVIHLHQNDESCVDDFGKTIFDFLGFNRKKEINIYGPTQIKYLISAQEIFANPDIVVQRSNLLFLIVQEDKSYKVSEANQHDEAEPQLVAEMVGAAYVNLQKSRGKLDNQTIYGIVMLGTYCTFYKIGLTKEDISRIVSGEKCKQIKNYVESYSLGKKDPKFIVYKPNLIKTLKCYFSLRNIVFNF